MNKFIFIKTVFFLLFTLEISAQVATVPDSMKESTDPARKFETYREKYQADIIDLGEVFDPFTGSMKFKQTDVSIQGNFDLPVEITRRRKDMLFGYKEGQFGAGNVKANSLFGDWELDIPYIPQATIEDFPNRCGLRYSGSDGAYGISSFAAGEGVFVPFAYPAPSFHFQGVARPLRLPAEKNKHLYKPGADYVTTDGWIATCHNSPFALMVESPNGDKYFFNNSDFETNGLYATKIEDRHGNWVKYENIFSTTGARIYSSDGREIKIFKNANGDISRIEANGVAWRYEYRTRPNAINVRGAKNSLNRVILPDNRYHIYSYGGYADINAENFNFYSGVPVASYHHKEIGKIITMNHLTPEGATVSYKFEIDSTCAGRHVLLRNAAFSDCSRIIGRKDLPHDYYAILDSKVLTYDSVNILGNKQYTWKYKYLGQAQWIKALDYNTGETFYKFFDPFVFNGETPTPEYNFPTRVTEIRGPDKIERFIYADGVYSTEGVIGTVTPNIRSGRNFYLNKFASVWLSEPTTFNGNNVNVDYFFGDLVAHEIRTKFGVIARRTNYEYDHVKEDNRWCSIRTSLAGQNLTAQSYPGFDNLYCHGSRVYGSFNSPSLDEQIHLRQSLRSHVRSQLSKKEIHQDGDIYTTEYLDWNDYGAVNLVKESNSFSSKVKYSRYNYMHQNQNNDIYLINQPKSKELSSDGINWTTVSETKYYDGNQSQGTAYMPKEKYSFGQLLESYQYHNTGELKQVNENFPNRWINYTHYQNGVARHTKKPGRYNANQTIQDEKIVNTFGSVTEYTDYKNHKTTYSYDDLQKLTYINPADTIWADSQFVYSYSDFPVKTEYQGDYSKTVSADSIGRPVLITESNNQDINLNRYKRFEYDSNHNITFASYISNSSNEDKGVSVTYDALDRVLSVTNSVNQEQVVYEYLPNNITKITDRKGNITQKQYLAYGQPEKELVINISEPENISTSIAYNIFDQTIRVSQGTISMELIYDDKQLLCKKFRPEKGWTYYGYNAIRELEWIAEGISSNTDSCDRDVIPNTAKIEFEFDNHGQVWKTNYQHTGWTIESNYDNNGNLTVLSTPETTWNYTYNSIDEIDSEILNIDNKVFQIIKSYDSLGNLNSLTYPSGRTVDFTPDVYGRATKLGEFANNIKFHLNDGIHTFNYQNGLVHTTNHNELQQIKSMTLSDLSGNNLLDREYFYDSNDNLELIQDNLDTCLDVNMQYDAADRLVVANGYWGTSNFAYDALGNINYKKIGDFELIYNYDGNNRLDTINGSWSTVFKYDSRGNVTSNGMRPFEFNQANQLIRSHNIDYIYDGSGRRVRKSANGNTEYSVYDSSGKLLHRVKADGSQQDYLYIGNSLTATINESGGAQFVHTDILGSPIMKTDSDGNIISQKSYQPYGLSENYADDKVGYTGHLEDSDLKLTYMQARYYDPLLARFYSTDPVEFFSDSTISFNRYAYANNNPYKYVDPDGRLPVAVVALIFVAKELAGEVFERTTGLPAPTVKGVGKATAKQLAKNKAAGAAFEKQVKSQLQKTDKDVAEQVTVKTKSGTKTRLDFVSKDSKGNIKCTECKASSTAPLTKNQKAGFPEIEKSGAEVVGKGKPGFPGGSKIPPTKVKIIRKED